MQVFGDLPQAELVAAPNSRALKIEATAKRRLADEYDAAQNRGKVRQQGRRKTVNVSDGFVPTAADLGFTRKDVQEFRHFATPKSPSLA